jgi:hypothetical protein
LIDLGSIRRREDVVTPRWFDGFSAYPLRTQIINGRSHPRQQQFHRRGTDACPKNNATRFRADARRGANFGRLLQR